MAEIPGYLLPKITEDGKQVIHQTSRPDGATTCFTSQGDLQSDSTVVGTSVWGGNFLRIEHEMGVHDATQVSYLDLNVMENTTYIHEGYIAWSGGNFDYVDLDMVPTITDSTAGSSTNYQLYGGYLITPAAGTGNLDIDPNDIRLVSRPRSLDTGELEGSGFWDADYDSTTHTFQNLTPAPYTGEYNMFASEVDLARFCNKFPCLDNGFLSLQTADVHSVPHGIRFKLTSYTDGSDHTWKAGVTLTFDREKTC